MIKQSNLYEAHRCALQAQQRATQGDQRQVWKAHVFQLSSSFLADHVSYSSNSLDNVQLMAGRDTNPVPQVVHR